MGHMIKTEGLLGHEFKHGVTDCFSVMRGFFALNFGLQFADWARPNDWWEPDPVTGQHLNLYMDHYRELGFDLFHGHPRDQLPGDVILMAIRAPVANHGAVLLPNDKILHHLVGQVSCIESRNRPLFRDTTVGILRHPAVDGAKLEQAVEIDAWDLVPQRIRDRLEDARQGTLDV